MEDIEVGCNPKYGFGCEVGSFWSAGKGCVRGRRVCEKRLEFRNGEGGWWV